MRARFVASCSSSPGFSLVEVALSLAILSVGMVGVLSLLPVGLDSARQVHSETLAASVARSAIGEVWISNRGNGPLSLPNGNLYYTAEGVKTTASNIASSTPFNRPYFQLEYTSQSNSPVYGRVFLRLKWPVAALESGRASTNVVQERTFLVDLNRMP